MQKYFCIGPKGTCPLDFLEGNPQYQKGRQVWSRGCIEHLKYNTNALSLGKTIFFWPAGGGDKFALVIAIKGFILFGKCRFGCFGGLGGRVTYYLYYQEEGERSSV